MKIGISTGCLYPLPTEKALEALAKLGFRTIEVFFNTFSELETDFLERMKYILQSYGAQVVSIHPFTSSYESFLLFSSYERRFLDGAGFYERYFRTAQTLGARKVILHGLDTRHRSTIPDETYFARFDLLQQRARRYGVTLLQENVVQFRSGSHAFLSAMGEQIPQSAAFVCDTKQAYRCGSSPLETARVMGSHLRHIHISGHSPEGECILPGRDRELEPLFAYLKEIRYSGDMIIEVYRSSYRSPDELWEAKQSLEKLAEQYGLAEPDRQVQNTSITQEETL